MSGPWGVVRQPGDGGGSTLPHQQQQGPYHWLEAQRPTPAYNSGEDGSGGGGGGGTSGSGPGLYQRQGGGGGSGGGGASSSGQPLYQQQGMERSQPTCAPVTVAAPHPASVSTPLNTNGNSRGGVPPPPPLPGLPPSYSAPSLQALMSGGAGNPLFVIEEEGPSDHSQYTTSAPRSSVSQYERQLSLMGLPPSPVVPGGAARAPQGPAGGVSFRVGLASPPSRSSSKEEGGSLLGHDHPAPVQPMIPHALLLLAAPGPAATALQVFSAPPSDPTPDTLRPGQARGVPPTPLSPAGAGASVPAAAATGGHLGGPSAGAATAPARAAGHTAVQLWQHGTTAHEQERASAHDSWQQGITAHHGSQPASAHESEIRSQSYNLACLQAAGSAGAVPASPEGTHSEPLRKAQLWPGLPPRPPPKPHQLARSAVLRFAHQQQKQKQQQQQHQQQQTSRGVSGPAGASQSGIGPQASAPNKAPQRPGCSAGGLLAAAVARQEQQTMQTRPCLHARRPEAAAGRRQAAIQSDELAATRTQPERSQPTSMQSVLSGPGSTSAGLGTSGGASRTRTGGGVEPRTRESMEMELKVCAGVGVSMEMELEVCVGVGRG